MQKMLSEIRWHKKCQVNTVMRETFQIGEIAELTNGRLIGEGARVVESIATDSRSLPGSTNVLFVAIAGDHHNGNDFLSEVYDKGIRCFLTDQDPKELFDDASYCITGNALAALQLLAAARRNAFKGTAISITGSNGKTIVKEWLYQILQRKASVVRSPRSYNSQLGVPLSIWQLSERYRYAIIEAGISRLGEMEKLERIIHPDIGILTNIGPAHNENFSSESVKLKEKLQLFRNCRKLIYNADLKVDNLKISEYLKEYNAEKVDWSVSGSAKYIYSITENIPGKPNLKLKVKSESYLFELPYTDGASVENLLNVITTLMELGMEPAEIAVGLKLLEPVEMRLETLNGVLGSTLVNDVYNADLSGLAVALNVLDQLKKHKKKVVILSDLYQSGMQPEDLYREVAGMLKFRNIDKVICVGENSTKQRHFFPDNSEFYDKTEDFLSFFNRSDINDAAVLIKGARKFHFEDITQLLQLQYHKTVLEINVNALTENLNYYRSLLNSRTKIMVMVKALSYGSGGDEIAAFLQHEKVDYLAVAFPDEGIRLRKAGTKLPVMVMNADKDDYRTLFEYNLEPEIYCRSGLEQFVRMSRFMGMADHPIHIKLDTGMHRLGFEEEDMEWLLSCLREENVVVKSIFTHLVGSDEPQLDGFSKQQAEKFKTMAGKIKSIAGDSVMLHMLNSAGIERFADYQFDMVRIGIGLYGHGYRADLAPVSTFKTVISQIRNVKKGDTVGYNRSGKVLRDSRIATIPVGYADGIDRRLGNGNYSFYLNGKKVPVIGNVCMDMTMIDISGVDATIGDTVELFGKNLPVSEMADKLDTIVYEILTSVPERVKRVYIRE